jgi:hypothetical protein
MQAGEDLGPPAVDGTYTQEHETGSGSHPWRFDRYRRYRETSLSALLKTSM